MKILSEVVAVLLALSLAGSTSWASSSAAAPGSGKAPAPATGTDKSKSGTAKKPVSKKGEVNLGSSARQELLKNSQAQKSAKGKSGALPKKTVQKKS